MRGPGEILLPRGDRDPASPALLADTGPPCSWGDLHDTLDRNAARLSRWMGGAGGAPRVLSLLPDEPGSALAVITLATSTAVAPVNPALRDGELRAFASRLSADAAAVRADRPSDRARVEALGLPTLLLAAGDGCAHCADFDLVAPDAPPRPRHGGPGLILSTSGTTGSPKLVPLGCGQMRRSAENIAAWLRLGPSDRALHMLPLFHVGAFVDLFLAPLVSGGSVYFGHPITTERLAEAIVARRSTWVQLVPTMLHHLLERSDERLADAARDLRFVRTVSADLAPALQARAADLFGDAPIIQMYGMTETAGQITSNPLPPGRARTGSVGTAAGPELRVMDAHANPRPPGEIGEICVSGPTVMSGYLDHDGGDVFHGRWLRTGDLGYLDESGFLTLTGRRKEMINRGGEKISPVEIERALLTHPDVLEAAAFAVEHATLGEEPMAAVVPVPGRRLEPDDAVVHARTRLADFKRPRRVLLLDALPRLGSGKIDRRRLRSVAEARDEDDGSETGELGRVARALSRIWTDTLGSAPRGPDTDFFDEGGDSLSATTFVVRVEESLGVVLPANLLYERPTFGALEEVVSSLPRERPRPDPVVQAVRRAVAGWAGVRGGSHGLLVGRHTVGSMTPFFFVTPGLAGSEDLVSAFHPERPVWVMRTLSGLRTRLGRRLKTEANNRRLAKAYADGIVDVHPSGPVLVGGFCQGADVARLVGEELRERGREISLIAVIDRLFTEPVRGRAAVVWTAGSRHSGNTQFRDPERHLDLLYPDGCTVLHLDSDHTEALLGSEARRIADYLEEASARALTLPPDFDPRASSEGLALRRRAHSARIGLRSRRFGAPGQPLRVHARVTNTSSVAWHAPGDGLTLCARWLNLDGHERTQRSADAPLPRPVAPGETVTVELSVPFPDKRLPMILMVDMVDDGLNWFHWVGSRPAYRMVWPDPFRRRNGSASGQR